jgi:hypothetical protein
MKHTYGNISPLVESQFPAFYREEGPLFVSFVKSYYEWLESSGNPLYYSRNLLSFKDVDTTLDEFLPHFQKMYLDGVSLTGVEQKRDVIKHALDIHRTKGTVQALRLVFRLLFNESVNVYYPGNDILRTSDGKWTVPIYLELSISSRTVGFVGKDITGTVSGARAFVENVVRRNHKGNVIDVAYLSNVRGQFITDELVSSDNIVEGSPRIVGSLTSIEVTTAGSDFEIGQVLNVASDRTGRLGKVRVTDVGIRTGEVNYRLLDGGFGYTLNANVFNDTQKVYVSANVLSITSFTSSNTSILKYDEFSTVKQPLVNVAFTSANVTFANGSLVYGVNSIGGYVAGGFILGANQVTTTGWLLISPHSVANVGLNTVTGANAISGSFVLGETVYQSNASGNAAVGVVVYANSSAATIDQRFGPFATNTLLIGNTSHCTANVTTVSTLAFDNTNFSNASITKIYANATTNGAVKSTVTDITATGTVIGSNAQAVGVYSITNAFIADSFNRNYIYDTSTQAQAVVTVISSGNPGGFKIGGISNTEIVYIGSDKLNGNNSGNVAFMSVRLNANNSNAASNTGYGFPRLPAANSSSVIGTALTKLPLTIGSIISLTERNPGNDNTAQPFVVEIEKAIAAYGKREIINLNITNQTAGFRDGELATQSIISPAITANVGSGVTGTFDTSGREVVKQVRSDGNTVYGEIYSAAVVGSNATLRILVSNTANTFDTSNSIVGTYSGATTTPNNIAANNLTINAKGIIESSNSSLVTLRRISFVNFVTGTLLLGAESGSTANVVYITEDASANVLGNNAVVEAAAGITNGTLSTVEVVDSGFSYQSGEIITLYADNNPIEGAGIVTLGTQGSSEGYWKGQDGFLDSNKYIQDNYYYQEYSYEIQSGLDQSKYNDFIKNTVHVAGTKMFGSFYKDLIGQNAPARVDATYPKITTLNLNSVTGNFTVGELVNQSNGISNTANGYVLSFSNTLNTLQLINTVGTFVTSNVVTGANSTAHGNTTTIEITIS